MAGLRGDIAVTKQRALVDVGIKFRLARGVVEVARPAHEIRNCARRAIAVEHLDDEAIGRDVLRDPGKGCGGGPRKQAARRFVAVNRPADEIVRTGITHLDDQPRHDGGGIDEGGGPLLRQRGLRAEGGGEGQAKFQHVKASACQSGGSTADTRTPTVPRAYFANRPSSFLPSAPWSAPSPNSGAGCRR